VCAGRWRGPTRWGRLPRTEGDALVFRKDVSAKVHPRSATATPGGSAAALDGLRLVPSIFLLAVLLCIPSYAEPPDPPARLTAFVQGGLWGYRDARGEVVIEPRYRLAQDFSPQGIAAVVDERGWCYIDGKGDKLIRPHIYDNGPDDFREGLARFRAAGRFGYFDETGRVRIKPQFAFALPFHEGLAAVCLGCQERGDGEHREITGGKWGYIDHGGETAIAPRFDAATPFEGGRARVMVDGSWITIDRNGEAIQK